MRHAAVLAAVLFLAPALAHAADPTFGSLSLDEAEKRLKSPDTYAIDCNPLDIFRRGHLPRARWVDYESMRASDLPPQKTATLIFYCANEH